MTELQPIDLATAKAQDFEAHLGAEFTLRAGEATFPVTLTDVSPYREQRRDAARPPFNMIFECSTSLLNQGTYQLELSGTPLCSLFLTPVEGGDGWCKLEAVFN